MSVFITINKKTGQLTPEFKRTIIKSKRELYYEQAQAIIDNVAPPGTLCA